MISMLEINLEQRIRALLRRLSKGKSRLSTKSMKVLLQFLRAYDKPRLMTLAAFGPAHPSERFTQLLYEDRCVSAYLLYWEDYLPGVGIHDHGGSSVGVHVVAGATEERLYVNGRAPSTRIIGPFGDITPYGNGQAYLTWYPAGLAGLSDDGIPPTPALMDREALIAETLAGLGVDRSILEEPHASWEVAGGYIVAHGYGDIVDAQSPLHDRSCPGARRRNQQRHL